MDALCVRYGAGSSTIGRRAESRSVKLDYPAKDAYSLQMGDTPQPLDAPPGWAEARDEGLAEFAAGLTVPGNVVMREPEESIARLEALRPE